MDEQPHRGGGACARTVFCVFCHFGPHFSERLRSILSHLRDCFEILSLKTHPLSPLKIYKKYKMSIHTHTHSHTHTHTHTYTLVLRHCPTSRGSPSPTHSSSAAAREMGREERGEERGKSCKGEKSGKGGRRRKREQRERREGGGRGRGGKNADVIMLTWLVCSGRFPFGACVCFCWGVCAWV